MSEHVEAVAKEEAKEEVSEENLQTAEQPAAEQQTAEPQNTAQESVEQESVVQESVEQDAVAQPAAESAEVPAAESAAAPEAETGSEDVSSAEAADVQGESAQAAASEPTAEESGEAEDDDSQDEKKVVRTLAVGQQVTGTVKRIADFGAFVDIGVGRDGLIHISELSVRRVGKVTDVLQEGQEVEAWIKKLDRDRNRISLTLIDPDTKTIRDLEKGDIVKGQVTRLLPYGAFIDIGIGRDALLHVREMAEGFVAKPEDVVQVGEELEARIIDLSRRRSRVDLSLKGLRPEPEAAIPHSDQTQAADAAQDEEPVEDAFENVEVLSAMELAFKRAMEAEGMELPEPKRGRRKGRTGRQIQDEIIQRTLSDSGR